MSCGNRQQWLHHRRRRHQWQVEVACGRWVGVVVLQDRLAWVRLEWVRLAWALLAWARLVWAVHLRDRVSLAAGEEAETAGETAECIHRRMVLMEVAAAQVGVCLPCRPSRPWAVAS